MKLLNKELLNSVTAQAKENSRLRMNYNFHASLDAKVQRLLNALEPGTELPIHRHLHTPETYILLRGSIKVLFYSDAAELIASSVLSAGGENFGVDIPAGQWHTLEVLESGTVIFEIKEGPYMPLEPSNIMTI